MAARAGEVNSEVCAVVASTYIVDRRSTCCSPRARSGWAVNCSCDTQLITDSQEPIYQNLLKLNIKSE